jgi:formylglycine-generating enzyme required for sulfatase activity
MSAARVPRLVVYVLGRECPLCDRAVTAVETVASERPVEWTIKVIDHDPVLAVRYALRVPVVEIDGDEALEGKVDAAALREALATRRAREGESAAAEDGGEPALSSASSSSAAGDRPGRRTRRSSAGARGRSPAQRLSDALGLGPVPAEIAGAATPSGRAPVRAYPRAVPDPEPEAEAETEAAGRGEPAPVLRVVPPPADEPPRDAMVAIPAGRFLYGPSRRAETLPAFEVDRDPVIHGDYERFVAATGHRPPLYWEGATAPAGLRDHPVVGVDYVDALAYARWAGKDLPYEDEWERAARGSDGRAYPWGDKAAPASNTAQAGVGATTPIGFHRENRSPDGCRDMVGNVWEWTHSPAPGGGLVVRGGSWFDPPAYAKTWFRFASRFDVRNGTIGFRCVRRARPRTDAPEPVLSPDALGAEIASRRGPQSASDAASWSAERRDLVVDADRLRALSVAPAAAADDEGMPPTPRRPVVKKAYRGAAAAPREKDAGRAVSPAATGDGAAVLASVPTPQPERKDVVRPVVAAPAPEPARVEGVRAEPGVAPIPRREPAKPPVEADVRAAPVREEKAPAVAATAIPPVSPSPPPVPSVPSIPSVPSVPIERAPVEPPAPPHVLVLFGLGVLAACVAAAVLITNVDRPPTAETAVPDVGPPLPAPLPAPGDHEAPHVSDGAAPRSVLLSPESRSTILVFARPDDEPGRATATLALDLHKRLRGRDAEVVLVVPRESVTPRGDASEAVGSLERAGIVGDLRVHLDAGGRVRETFRAGEGNAAVLVRDGVVVLRARTGDRPLTLVRVKALVLEALSGPAGD